MFSRIIKKVAGKISSEDSSSQRSVPQPQQVPSNHRYSRDHRWDSGYPYDYPRDSSSYDEYSRFGRRRFESDYDSDSPPSGYPHSYARTEGYRSHNFPPQRDYPGYVDDYRQREFHRREVQTQPSSYQMSAASVPVQTVTARSPPMQPATSQSSRSKPRLERKYSKIADEYRSLDEVTEALAKAGLESSNLIIGIDFTKSNEWTGKHSFKGRSLHYISDIPNPYEEAISIIGRTLSAFDEDNLIPCFGFGDASTHDQDVFSFYPDERPCNGFPEALSRYKQIVPHLRLSGNCFTQWKSDYDPPPSSISRLCLDSVTKKKKKKGEAEPPKPSAPPSSKLVPPASMHLSRPNPPQAAFPTPLLLHPLMNTTTNGGPTSFAPIIEMATTIVEQSGGQYHVLVIIADGQVTRSVDTELGQLSPQEQKTVDSIVLASQFPLSIILVGVGDGPWDMMREFDDNIPARSFDNFQFVNFTEIMSKNASPTRKETEFALAALMEVPLQYKATLELGILGRVLSKSPGKVSLPPPLASFNVTSFQSNYVESGTHKVPEPSPIGIQSSATTPAASSDTQCCPVCLTGPRDMAFGCGHQTCRDCGPNLHSCPICRRPIDTRIRLY
ncbi:hypothetical protein LUZ62_046384 [Rhynchospora pubera]|uniref:RING-type domain-containing protein n=1 Tax=Rhynchospora pubera TaxID=906938 RepID=A0AAV8FWC1_9POAL|nr:hypothetical protein LUZ62_046384 [Rhynchospora pubera]